MLGIIVQASTTNVLLLENPATKPSKKPRKPLADEVSCILGAAPIPENEAKRLAALHDYGILDTAPDPAYDAFADLAAQLCRVPVALVSLVDTSRQWFKANVGLPSISETPRDVAFCAHALASDVILEVADATLDPRFAENPLVTGDPYFRFYAGMPLIDRNGNALGTLCTLDYRPRSLTDEQRHGLQALATSLVTLIEARRGVPAKSLEQLAVLSGALEYASEPFMIVRRNGESDSPTFTYVNRAFTALFGYALTDLVGAAATALQGPLTDDKTLARLQAAVASGEPASETLYLYGSGGVPRLVELRDRAIDYSHRIACLRDLTRISATQDALSMSNLRLQALLANNNDSVFTLDADGSCVDANAASSELFGYSRSDLLGFGYFMLSAGGLFAEREIFPQYLHDGRTAEFSTHYKHVDGRLRYVRCKAIPIIVRGATVGAYVMSKDVTEAAQLERVISNQAKRTHALCAISAAKGAADSSQIDSILALALEAFDMQFGYVGEIVGSTLHVTNAVGDPIERPGTSLQLEKTYVVETLASGDVCTISDVSSTARADEDPHYRGWHGYISAPLTIDGKIYGAIGFLSRSIVTFNEFDRDFMRLVAAQIASTIERHLQKQRLDRLAHFDALTGLPNRRKFQADLDTAVSRGRRHQRAFALHFIDLDGFKDVNDRFGHEIGDLALEEVGRRLKRALRGRRGPARRRRVRLIASRRAPRIRSGIVGPPHRDALVEAVRLTRREFRNEREHRYFDLPGRRS